jgi:hypothetical protein
MLLSDIFLRISEGDFEQLVRGISMGKLRTYQMFESFRIRARLAKLNTEILRKTLPRFRGRLTEHDEDFAKDLAQVILLSHLDMIGAILDYLKIPNQGGFFAKDIDPASYLTAGWQGRVYGEFSSAYPGPALPLYINHLAWELDKTAEYFTPGQ